MATKLKVRFEPKGNGVMPVALFANGRPIPFGMPIEGRKKGALIQTLTKGPVEFVIEDLAPTRGPGRPRKTPLAGTATASMGRGTRTTGMTTGMASGMSTATPRKRGRPRRTPIS